MSCPRCNGEGRSGWEVRRNGSVWVRSRKCLRCGHRADIELTSSRLESLRMRLSRARTEGAVSKLRAAVESELARLGGPAR